MYKTSDEFINDRPYVCANCSENKSGVKISDFFLRPYISVYTDTGKIKINIDSVYAVKCGNEKKYRIWNQKPYMIEEIGSIIIYSVTYKKNTVNRTPRGCRSKRIHITNYYFSKTLTSPLLQLTHDNLVRAMKFSEHFEVFFLNTFSDDASLRSKNNNQYSINDFLKQHLK